MEGAARAGLQGPGVWGCRVLPAGVSCRAPPSPPGTHSPLPTEKARLGHEQPLPSGELQSLRQNFPSPLL